MKISEVKNAIRVGEIVLGSKQYKGKNYVFYDTALEFIYDENFPKKLKNKYVALIYIFVVNGVIYKFGQSSCKTGISGCIGFYLKSGQDDPGINRFAINWFIRDEIKKSNKVEVYMVYMDLIKTEVPGLFENEICEVAISAKGMEGLFLKQYFKHKGCYPEWNYQESGKSLPSEITSVFGEYINQRGKGRSN